MSRGHKADVLDEPDPAGGYTYTPFCYVCAWRGRPTDDEIAAWAEAEGHEEET